MRLLAGGVIVALLAGCGRDDPAVPPDDGGPALSDAGSDAGTDSGYPYDLPVSYPFDAGAPITAASETWTFVAVPDALCGNGSSTGMAVNLTSRSNRVVVVLAGGGACWEAAACALGTATHIQDTLGEPEVLGEASSSQYAPLFTRTDAANPFKDASFVYLPYCTGDLHAGTQQTTYEWFGQHVVHHVGAKNMDAYLRRIAPTFGGVDRVWLAGGSAGGYGATLNWWRVQKAMPWARVDVVNDSGLMIDPAGDGRYPTMQQRWAPELPPGCTGCTTSLTAALTSSAALLGAPRRYAMLGLTQDNVIGAFFGLQGSEIEARLLALRASEPSNVRTFYVTGSEHVVLAQPAQLAPARAWLQQFVDDGQAFGDSGP